MTNHIIYWNNQATLAFKDLRLYQRDDRKMVLIDISYKMPSVVKYLYYYIVSNIMVTYRLAY